MVELSLGWIGYTYRGAFVPTWRRTRMDAQLAGKRAIVTGGSRGIGKAVARAFASEGVAVAIGARTTETLQASAAELRATGATVVPIVVDTGEDESVRAFVADAAEALGGVDILVNSAAQPSGQARAPKVVEVDAEAFFADVNVKVLGYLRMIRQVAPFMAANGWGRIINVDGLGARMAGSVVTSMRNAAVAALTKNAADELGGSGINVSGVSPALVRTEATPRVLGEQAGRQRISVEELEARIGDRYAIGRMVSADEVAAVVTWLASPLSVAVTGDVIACGGGVKGPIYY
jgi:NAD(P)-dependent dehydrogenase (short-subunit alcohol dehydrogenase family)